MKKVVNKIAYLASAVSTAVPMIVSAQFQEPTGTGLPAGSVLGIVTQIMNWLLIMVGILGVVGFVIAGIIYLTAAGDETQLERGKRTAINSIIGIIVALLGIIIIQAVKSMLSGSSKSF